MIIVMGFIVAKEILELSRHAAEATEDIDKMISEVQRRNNSKNKITISILSLNKV